MTTGMLLGKFMPPHKGHLYLARFAENYVDDLYIVVGSLKDEPIPGDIRFEWMKELFPNATVIHLDEELPQKPEDHPDFWKLWEKALLRVLPSKPDYVFAGEDYGEPLAKTLGAEFIPSNMGRDIIPTSGTEIRDNPFENWEHIPEVVRSYFLKKICIVGPESTGKSTLAKKLAEHFQTVHVPEYAYTVISKKGKDNLELKDMEIIARGQKASEEALAQQANKVIFSDTDTMTTSLWSQMLFQDCPDWVTKEAKNNPYDLYFLMDTGQEWMDDVHRYSPETQEEFMKACEKRLAQMNVPYIKLSGNWDARFEKAKAAVNSYMTQQKPKNVKKSLPFPNKKIG